MNVEVNYLALLLAAASSLVVGMVWYADGLFGKSWRKMVGLSQQQQRKGMGLAVSGSVVLAFVMAYVLAHVSYISQSFFKVSFMESALNTSFWLWLGVSVPTIVRMGLFEQTRKKLMAITVGAQLVTLMVMGLIIGALGV